MNSSFVRSRNAAFVGLILTSVAMAACGGSDEVGASKLKPIHAGTPRDTVLRIMGDGPLSAVRANVARLEHGYRKQGFLINSKMYEVLWYRTEPGDVSDIIRREKETPIVLAQDTVIGWGWKYYLTEGPKVGLPNALAAEDSAKVADYQRAADSVKQKRIDDSVRTKKAADSAYFVAHPPERPKLPPPAPPKKKP